MEVRNELARATGQELPATLVLIHPTAKAIAALLGIASPAARVCLLRNSLPVGVNLLHKRSRQSQPACQKGSVSKPAYTP